MTACTHKPYMSTTYACALQSGPRSQAASYICRGSGDAVCCGSMPSVYGPALECRLSSLQYPGCPWPSHILEPVHAVSLVSPMPAPAQLHTAIDQLSAFVTVVSGTIRDLLAASLHQQQPGATWQAVSVAPGDVVCINAPGSLHIGANASSYSQLGLQGTCVGPAADPTHHIHIKVQQPPDSADAKDAKMWQRLQRLSSPITCLALHTRSGDAQPLPPSPGVTSHQQLALEHASHTLQQQQVPLLTRQVLEGWCKGGAAGQACLQQLHEYLGALVCGIGGVQWQHKAAAVEVGAAAAPGGSSRQGKHTAQTGAATSTRVELSQPLEQAGDVEVHSWRGLVAAPQVQGLVEACCAAVEAGHLPWAALVLSPFEHVPSRWSGSRQQLEEGWGTSCSQVLLVLPEGACCLMTSTTPRQVLR